MSWRDTLKRDITPGFLRRPRGRAGLGALLRPLAWYSQQWRRDMRAVFVQLESIVRNNASLPDGLLVCALDAPSRAVARLLRRLSEEMDKGARLSEAMWKNRRDFNAEWVALVRAGEQSGKLVEVLSRIGSELGLDLDRGRLMRNRIAYFVFLVFTQAFIMTFVVVRVLPVFAEIIDEFAGDLPLPVRVLYAVVDAVPAYYGVLLAGLVCLVLGIILAPALYRVSGAFQSLVAYLALPFPIAGRMVRRKHTKNAAAMLELLLGGGMPLPDALQMTADEAVPQPYRRALLIAKKEVEQGGRLSDALAKQTYLWGPSFPALIRLGEGRGDIAGACAQARDLARRSIVRMATVLSDSLVPVGVFACAIGVFTAALAVFTSFIVIGDSIIGTF